MMDRCFCLRQRRNAWCGALLASLVALMDTSLASSPSGGGMILRVRLGNGSMQRIQVPLGLEDSTTLSEILAPFHQPDESNPIIQVGSECIEDDSQTLTTLGLKHGSLITLMPPRSSLNKDKQTSKFSQTSKDNKDRFDPYPDLARDYQTALRRKARRQGGMTYSDIAHVQSALHVVEPQPEGPLKRVYMCHTSAARFQSSGITKKEKSSSSSSPLSRVGLLFGTLQRERADLKPVKARTSLSSTPSESEFCHVAKVHALWEPPQQASTKRYDSKTLLLLQDNPITRRALTIASWLDLTPVGWIFSYTDNRSKDEESLPVLGQDVWTGASLEIANMKASSRENGSKFVTLAMDAKTGETEAFQLSHVSVQMVAENMWEPEQAGRFVTTQHEIIVDGKETTQLDSVLCLVNTAMLSHQGAYAGKSDGANRSVKRNGALTNKTKKTLLDAVNSNNDAALLNALSDFNVLVALDALLPPDDMKELCRLVRRLARGQQKGTKVDCKLKLTLESVLNS